MIEPQTPAPLKPVDPLLLSAQQNFLLPPQTGLKPGSLLWRGKDDNAVIYGAEKENGDTVEIRIFSVMSEDEKIIFRSFADFYAAALKRASESVKGYYTFEVLQFFVGDAPRGWNEFAALLVNHAAKTGPAERRLIQFGSLWGVLERHSEADFGRIESKLKLEFYKPSAESALRWFKKTLTRESAENRIVIFRDESAQPFMNQPEAEESLRGLKTGGESAFFWHAPSKRHLRI